MNGTATEAGHRVLQVSGGLCFEPHQWRKAILYYLNGVWSGNHNVMYRPKISLGNLPAEGSVSEVVLRLSPATKEYYAYGTSAELPIVVGNFLVVGCGQNEVEGGLIRFVRNDRIRNLSILFRDGGNVCLLKGRKRSDLHVWAARIPEHLEAAFQE